MQQLLAFNGDSYLLNEVLKLKEQFQIDTIIETGTHVGYTAAELSKHFYRVYTIETNFEYYRRSMDYCRDNSPNFYNIRFYLGNSIVHLPQILELLPKAKMPMIYLDGHWEGEPTPLLHELSIIANSIHKPVIMIHDFKVPDHPELGFDTYDGQPYEWEWIRPHIEKIYGKEGYRHYYNEKTDPNGPHHRGCVFVVPVI